MSHNQAVSSICNKSYVTNDLLKLPDNVTITCDDGDVRANMELLSVRSDFFLAGFNNPGFLESRNKSLRMKGCSKAAMEAIKTYLYTGEMDFKQLELSTLLYIMNVSREIFIEEELFSSIGSYIKVAFSPDRYNPFHDIVKLKMSLGSLKLVERFRLDNVRDVLLEGFNFLSIVHFLLKNSSPDVQDFVLYKHPYANDRRREFFHELKSLPMNIMKKLLLCDVSSVIAANPSELHWANPSSVTKGRFDVFLAWYVANKESCTEEVKKEIRHSFNYDHFTGEELVTVVGRSGLLPKEEVERMVVERFRKCGEGKANGEV